MHDDLDLNDVISLGHSDGPSGATVAGAKLALEAAKAGERSAGRPASVPKPHGRVRSVFGRRSSLLIAAVAIVGAGAAYATAHALHRDTTSSAVALPKRSAALACVTRFNGPAGEKLRAVITGTATPASPYYEPGVFVQTEVRQAGTPVSATFRFSGQGRAECPDPGVLITFQKGERVTTLGFPDVARPYSQFQSALSQGVAMSRLLTAGGVTTRVLAGGMLSADIQPPRAVGAWGGSFRVGIRQITQSANITGRRTCVFSTITVNRLGLVLTEGSRIESATIPVGQRLASPGNTEGLLHPKPGSPSTGRTCFYWNGHAADPPSEPRYWRHPDEALGATRTIALQIDDAGGVSHYRVVTLRFRVVPVDPRSSAPAKWRLVYRGATTAPGQGEFPIVPTSIGIWPAGG